jgi:hypothetical protein
MKDSSRTNSNLVHGDIVLRGVPREELDMEPPRQIPFIEDPPRSITQVHLDDDGAKCMPKDLVSHL